MQQLREILKSDGIFASLLRDLYSAEVFLSLDAASDGETYFREELAAAKNDPAKLSASLVLGQLLLLQGKRAEYAQLAVETMAPLLLKVELPLSERKPNELNAQSLLDIVGSIALLPACAPEFLKLLPEQTVRLMLTEWQVLLMKVDRDFQRQQVDLFLMAAHGRLGQEEEQMLIERRLNQNKEGPMQMLSVGNVGELIESLRKMNQAAVPQR
jgi:hypothetical protein